jgi:hypothetical protein
MAFELDTPPNKRLLRLRIARLRRRIDGRVHGLGGQGRRLASWKTYVTRYPAYAVLAALGLGLTASAGLGKGGWTRMLGLLVVRRAARHSVDAVFAELKAIWADAAGAAEPAEPEGDDHGRS